MLKIGHRGAAGLAPENTLLSLQKAIDLGVDMVEFDVHLCQSGEVVIIHDQEVDRTTNGTGQVTQMTLSQLQALDAGQGQAIPTLAEALDLINRRVGVMLELKGESTAKPVYKILQSYINQKKYFYEDFIIVSFDHHQLTEFSRLSQKFRLGPSLETKPIGYAEFAAKLPAQYINLAWQYADKNFVIDAHRRQLKVIVWTVNNLEDINHLTSLGIDGICSDYPNLFSN
ncbi:MAG: hypothetical protein A2744_03965 [Candidatus Buchananbacteria bacterium RIFCSPHIGHO2_01_FULL_44_11]|uniref:GP-PDE domain-containing protein n=1 Tax=Candidatus Buchananbacteria bacterium RIFCSPHIGHO2_01_FULL_44_11 TaxID=1797535 RepID=A0A1G1Y190_9BACT|nr:MAG: hypothetical protein A2744_03965 [Candidatus Buchananbacteria bacterium RIFCSPHIGHO2_01_FULL_44_11]